MYSVQIHNSAWTTTFDALSTLSPQEARLADRLCCHLRLTGLPPGGRKSKVVNEIQKLVYNCGGRVERVNLPEGEAIVVFPSPSNAARWVPWPSYTSPIQ